MSGSSNGSTATVLRPGGATADSRGRRAADDRRPALARRYGDCLRAVDSGAAEKVIDEAIEVGLSGAEVHTEVIQPAMERIGDLWAEGAITVADEHLATAISQQMLIRLYESLQTAPPRSRERIMLAGVEGQHHVLGLRMVADLLEGSGFDVMYLGADVPTSSLTNLVQVHEPAIVGLTFGIDDGSSRLSEAVTAIHESSWQTRVLLGGDGVPPNLRHTANPWLKSSADLLGVVEAIIDRPAPALPPAFAISKPDVGPGPALASYDAGAPVAQIANAVEEATVQSRHYARKAESYRHLALHDPVTELPNRRAFDDRMHSLCDRATDGVLLMIDLDGFKEVNDAHGHEAGDELLRAVGRSINLTLRIGDFAARIGGDEFGVLLPGRSAFEGAAVAERIRKEVKQHADHGMTVSLGMASLTPDLRGTLLNADRALYRAKAGGRDQTSNAQLSAENSRVRADPSSAGAPRGDVAGSRPLTKREREVLGHVSEGLLNAEIATLLVLSTETVKSHMHNTMMKLGAKTRAHAVTLALEEGQIKLPALDEAR